MKKKVIIYGIGKFAEYAAYLFENDSIFKVHGFCIERDYIEKSDHKIKNLMIFEDLNKIMNNDFSIFIAVGNNQIRERIFKTAKELKYNLASYSSSKAIFWPDLSIEENVFIGEGSVIQPHVKIKANSFIIGGRLGHHSYIDNHVLLSGSTIGGNVIVGKSSYIGLNTSIKQNIKIGANTIIGMNCTIEKDTPRNSVYSNKATKKRNIDSLVLGNRFLK